MKEMLNKAQQEAVETTEGGVLVIAGPGSGKTKTLVERTVYLLVEKKVRPENILISTFTDKAANELITRISGKIKNSDLKLNINKMYIGTLHSIFRQIIEENIEYSEFNSGFKILDDADQHFFIYKNMKIFSKLEGYKDFFDVIPAGNIWEKSRKLLEWVNNLSEYGKMLDSLKTSDRVILFIKELQAKYRELLIESNSMDFSTIQSELYLMLKNNPELVEKVSDKIHYIMVDEYQDTNVIQEKLVFILGSKHKNICVVGDDDQAIYRFRGATVKNILRFPTRFEEGECKKIKLDINYRSQLDILRFCNKWISLLNWGGARHLKRMKFPDQKVISPTSSAVRIGGFGERNWAENIYKFIKMLKESKKISDYSQVAFLFRSLQNKKVRYLKSYLKSMGIPVYSPRSKEYFDQQEIKLAIGAMLVVFPQTKNMISYDFSYYADCKNELKKKIDKDKKLYKWLVEERKANAVREKLPNLKEIFYQLLQFDTFKQYMFVGEENKNIDELEKMPTHNIAMFTDILERYEHLTKIDEITSENVEMYIGYFFKSYLNQLLSNKLNEYENKESFPRGAVPFITFHQSKGLEFPVVVVGSLDRDVPKEMRSIENEKKDLLGLRGGDLDEEQLNKQDYWRIYYTAFSRAQDLLVLTANEDKYGLANYFQGLFYLLPDWKDYEKFELEHLHVTPYKEGENKKLLSYTGDVLGYEFCPLKYQLSKKFKFRERKKPSSFYGIFFHKIIEDIHKYAISKQELPPQDWIDRKIARVRKQLEKDFIYSFTDSDILKLEAGIKKYLETIVIENLVESEMKLNSFEDKYILEGILDLVRKNDTGFEIVDFKTGKLNKNYIERYKRQLAVYTHLLSSDYEAKNISAYLYFPEEINPYIYAEITKEDIDKELERFDKTVVKILEEEFVPRNFDEACQSCDFKWYCQSNIEKEEE